MRPTGEGRLEDIPAPLLEKVGKRTYLRPTGEGRLKDIHAPYWRR